MIKFFTLYMLPICFFAEIAAGGYLHNSCLYYKTFPSYPCLYDCVTPTGKYYTLRQDGGSCSIWYPMGRFAKGVCYNGLCIPRSVLRPQRPPFPPAGQPSTCFGEYGGNGYATTCTFTCPSGAQGKYSNKTPCLRFTADNQRIESAGLCLNGECIPKDDLENQEATHMVFPIYLNQCPVKNHYGRNVLFECNYYCSKGNDWYYGHYASNTSCQVPGVNRLGWCCNGTCFSEVECRGSELKPGNSFSTTLL